LHLIGSSVPTAELDRKSGSASQMQRELQWFKVIMFSQTAVILCHTPLETNFLLPSLIENTTWLPSCSFYFNKVDFLKMFK